MAPKKSFPEDEDIVKMCSKAAIIDARIRLGGSFKTVKSTTHSIDNVRVSKDQEEYKQVHLNLDVQNRDDSSSSLFAEVCQFEIGQYVNSTAYLNDSSQPGCRMCGPDVLHPSTTTLDGEPEKPRCGTCFRLM